MEEQGKLITAGTVEELVTAEQLLEYLRLYYDMAKNVMQEPRDPKQALKIIAVFEAMTETAIICVKSLGVTAQFPFSSERYNECEKVATPTELLTKCELFVRHIEAHLDPGQAVICKICGKTISEIARDDQ